MTSLTSMEMKKLNRNRIYQLLYKGQELSVLEMARTLHLSLPTVMQNLKELTEKRLVREAGFQESTGGRKARIFKCNYRARFSVGLDVTKNHIALVLIDMAGEIQQHVRLPYVFARTPAYFAGVGRHLQEFLENSRVNSARILGVGIALPAIVSSDGEQVKYATVIDFQGGQVEDFAEHIPFSCCLMNDANAAGFTELWGKDPIANVVYLSLNNSVGGSVMVDQKVYTGDNQRGGEFGHMTIVPGGELCYCGQRGCVDAYCSARLLSDTAGGKIAEYFRQLKEQEPAAVKLWQSYVDKLVLVINNLRMNFDCKVILGGYAGAYMEDYIDEIRAAAAAKNTFETDGSYIHVCRYKLEATAVGAALQHMSGFIQTI